MMRLALVRRKTFSTCVSHNSAATSTHCTPTVTVTLSLSLSFHYHLQNYSTQITIKSLNEKRVSEGLLLMDGTRRVGVAVDFSVCSKKALQWAVDNVVRDGDHLILLTVLPVGSLESGEQQLWESDGSPLIPLSEFSEPSIMKKYGVKPDTESLDIVSTVARQKQIVVVMKIFWGDAREKLCEAIDKIPLSCIVIGNRGLGKLKRAIMGSVSNYVVNNGSCPVTVVKQGLHET